MEDADEGAPVVADPEHGWLQLKAQLLRDVAAGGSQILPVQLAIGLDSVRRFRFLTPAEYAKNGGARGLERLHIERHLHDAARGTAGLMPEALLRGLMCLVTELSKKELKTKRATTSEFVQAIGVTEPKAAALETVVEHLVRWRILRRQSSAEGEYLLLHHDYLARGVNEAYRQANYWVTLLRERTRELEEAFGWRQRWRALLPLVAQARLFWGRLRGGFRYGEHRRLALWSTLRLLPVAVALALVIGAGWWVDRANQQQLAERVLAGISSDPKVSRDEAQEWRQLAGARWPARFHAVQIALSRSSIAPKAIEKGDLLAHVAVGLDPVGELSRQLVPESILPSLEQPDSTICGAAGTIVLRLRVAEPDSETLARALIKRMESGQDSYILNLGEALAGLSGTLEAKDVQPGAAALVKRMESEQDSYTLWKLGEALARLSGKLEAKDVQPGAAALVKRMEREEDSYTTSTISNLGEALARLSGKLEAKDVRLLAAALLKRMESEKNSSALSELGKALAGLSGKLEAKDAQPLAAALVKRMEREQDSFTLWALGVALAGLSGKLEAKDVQPGVAPLVKRMETEQDTFYLLHLVEALAGLSGKLEAKDAQPLVAALVKLALIKLMEREHSFPTSALGALAGLGGKVEAKDAQPLAAGLVKRMESEQDSYTLSRLGEALAGLSGKLEAKDAQPPAAALVKLMESEQDNYTLSSLGEALARISHR